MYLVGSRGLLLFASTYCIESSSSTGSLKVICIYSYPVNGFISPGHPTTNLFILEGKGSGYPSAVNQIMNS